MDYKRRGIWYKPVLKNIYYPYIFYGIPLHFTKPSRPWKGRHGKSDKEPLLLYMYISTP